MTELVQEDSKRYEVDLLRGVAALLYIGTTGPTFRLRLDFIRAGRLIRLWPKGIVFISCSRERSDCENEELGEIVDVQIAHGRSSTSNLAGYAYGACPENAWNLHFEGQFVLTLVCVEIAVEEMDLAPHYPAIP